MKPDDQLTLVEASTLVILLCEAREVPNSYLTNEARVKLAKESREHLAQLGLVEVRKEKNRYFLNVTDRGWAKALEIIDTELPARAGAAGAGLFFLVRTLRRYLTTSGVPAAEFFLPGPPPPGTGDIAQLIRKAYDSVAGTHGEPVQLLRLRQALGDGLNRRDVDAALIKLGRESDVFITPESNQKTLTDSERRAAVSIGNQDKHLIAISSK